MKEARCWRHSASHDHAAPLVASKNVSGMAHSDFPVKAVALNAVGEQVGSRAHPRKETRLNSTHGATQLFINGTTLWKQAQATRASRRRLEAVSIH